MHEQIKLKSEKIRELAGEIGIEEIGIIQSREFQELIPKLRRRESQEKLTGFEERDIDKRINPALTMDGCKSIIVALFPYKPEALNEMDECSNLSVYARGTDYHFVALDMMRELTERIQQNYPQFQGECYADSGPLVDRFLAFDAGLGFWGMNGNLINHKYGSYFFIAYTLCNMEVDIYNKPLDKKTCCGCMRCVEACPGKAIEGNYDIDPRKCKSFITQKKGELKEWEIEILQNTQTIFGCDICQDVCPHNLDIEYTHIEEFKNNLKNNLDKDEIEELSNKEFKRKYGRKAFAWRGKGILKRNIDIIRGKNYVE